MATMKTLCGTTLCALGLLVGAAQAQEAAKPDFKTVGDKASYAIGVNIGNSIIRDKLEVNAEMIVRGLNDALTKQKPALTEEEMMAAMQAFQKEAMAQMATRREKEGQSNVTAGKEFLAANKAKPGVVTTKSGLQYKVVKEGTGAAPKATDTVKVHYKGTLLNGKTFDSSYDRGEPATFPVNQVIPGWTEALQLMKVGSKYQLFIPSELAYGERGAGGDIGPNETLVFDVELLGIEK